MLSIFSYSDINLGQTFQVLDDNVKAKLSQFCHIPVESIMSVHDVPNIWHVPLLLRVSFYTVLKFSLAVDEEAHEYLGYIIILGRYLLILGFTLP